MMHPVLKPLFDLTRRVLKRRWLTWFGWRYRMMIAGLLVVRSMVPSVDVRLAVTAAGYWGAVAFYLWLQKRCQDRLSDWNRAVRLLGDLVAIGLFVKFSGQQTSPYWVLLFLPVTSAAMRFGPGLVSGLMLATCLAGLYWARGVVSPAEMGLNPDAWLPYLVLGTAYLVGLHQRAQHALAAMLEEQLRADTDLPTEEALQVKLTELLTAIRREIDSDDVSFSVQLYERASATLKVVQVMGDGFDLDLIGKVTPVGLGVTGQVARERKPYCMRQRGDLLPGMTYLSFSEGMNSELAVPILAGRDLVGVLNMESPRENAFSETFMRWLQEYVNCSVGRIVTLIRARETEGILSVLSRITRSIHGSLTRDEKAYLMLRSLWDALEAVKKPDNDIRLSVEVREDDASQDWSKRVIRVVALYGGAATPRGQSWEPEAEQRSAPDWEDLAGTRPRWPTICDLADGSFLAELRHAGNLVGWLRLRGSQQTRLSSRDRNTVWLASCLLADLLDDRSNPAAQPGSEIDSLLSAARTISIELEQATVDKLLILDKATRVAMTLVGAPFGTLSLVNWKEKMIEEGFTHYKGGWNREATFPRSVGSGYGTTVEVARTGRSILHKDLSTVPRDKYLKAIGGMKSEVAVPVWLANEVVAVFDLETPTMAHFVERHQDLLARFSRSVSFLLLEAGILDAYLPFPIAGRPELTAMVGRARALQDGSGEEEQLAFAFNQVIETLSCESGALITFDRGAPHAIACNPPQHREKYLSKVIGVIGDEVQWKIASAGGLLKVDPAGKLCPLARTSVSNVSENITVWCGLHNRGECMGVLLVELKVSTENRLTALRQLESLSEPLAICLLLARDKQNARLLTRQSLTVAQTLKRLQSSNLTDEFVRHALQDLAAIAPCSTAIFLRKGSDSAAHVLEEVGRFTRDSIDLRPAERMRIRLGRDVLGNMALLRRISIITDVNADSKFYAGDGAKWQSLLNDSGHPLSLMIVPISSRTHDVQAVMVLARRSLRRESAGSFLPEERELVGSFGRIVGTVLDQRAEMDFYAALWDMIGHELKNPMNNIRAQLPFLCDVPAKGDLAPQRSQYVPRVERNVVRFERLLRGIKAFRSPETLTRVDLTDLCRGINTHFDEWMRSDFADVRGDRMVMLKMKLPEAPCHVLAERGMLEIFLYNLVKNSMEHGGGVKSIKLRLTTREEGQRKIHCLEYKDDGGGIPDEVAEAVFKRHVSQISRKQDGTRAGLGLYICGVLATAMNGKLSMIKSPRTSDPAKQNRRIRLELH
ncbi:MAG: GAF domain-containing protein, partial [Candidatus Wallbacteria bacterium]|nr:GAF domain-containing protein [Candidatus Wallbacteria bacterium]